MTDISKDKIETKKVDGKVSGKFFSLPVLICTFFGVGKIPFAPGTWGSAVATLLVAIIFYQPHFVTIEDKTYFEMGAVVIDPNYIVHVLCLIAVFLYIFGVWASDKYPLLKDNKDPSEIVIDEVAGIFTAASLIAVGYSFLLFLNESEYIFYLMLSYYFFPIMFILFRIFDILKPWHVGKADKKLTGGYGIMMDDQIAGVYTAISFFVIFFALKYSGLLESLIQVE